MVDYQGSNQGGSTQIHHVIAEQDRAEHFALVGNDPFQSHRPFISFVHQGTDPHLGDGKQGCFRRRKERGKA